MFISFASDVIYWYDGIDSYPKSYDSWGHGLVWFICEEDTGFFSLWTFLGIPK